MQNQATSSAPQRIELVLPSAEGGSDWIAVANAVAWPLAALLIVVLLRQAIADVLRGIGTRAKSLSLGVVAFELGETAAPALSGSSLDDIRDTATHAPVGDSGAALASSLNDRGIAECTIIDIGNGDEWITSRLYVVVTLIARMRGVRVAVFTASGPNGQQFLGVATTDHVRWALAAAYPWLELAYLQAWNSHFAGLDPRYLDPKQMPLTSEGRLESWRAAQILDLYRNAIQYQGPQAPPGAGWLSLRDGLWERADWLTPALLHQLLGVNFVQASVQHDFDTSDEELGRRVLRFPHDFVPIVDRAHVFQRLVVRREYVSRTLKRIADSV